MWGFGVLFFFCLVGFWVFFPTVLADRRFWKKIILSSLKLENWEISLKNSISSFRKILDLAHWAVSWCLIKATPLRWDKCSLMPHSPPLDVFSPLPYLPDPYRHLNLRPLSTVFTSCSVHISSTEPWDRRNGGPSVKLKVIKAVRITWANYRAEKSWALELGSLTSS